MIASGAACAKKKNMSIQDKVNMLFSSTTITNGLGRGVVTHIGMGTEIGKISAAVTEAKDEEEDTPLKKKIDEFGDLLAKVREREIGVPDVVSIDTMMIW